MTWTSTPEGLYGESGIRTHGTLTSTHAFQACTFGHSVISPNDAPPGRRGLGLNVPVFGESGIRTHGAASGSTVFETARFDRSRISPNVPKRIRTSDLWIRNP